MPRAGIIVIGLGVGIGLILVLLSIHSGSNNGVYSLNINGAMFASGIIIAIVATFVGALIERESAD